MGDQPIKALAESKAGVDYFYSISTYWWLSII